MLVTDNLFLSLLSAFFIALVRSLFGIKKKGESQILRKRKKTPIHFFSHRDSCKQHENGREEQEKKTRTDEETAAAVITR